MTVPDERQFRDSSYREMILEVVFIGSLLRHLWENHAPPAEILYATVDNSGYDVVIDCNSVQRHIQLKSQISALKKKNNPILVNDKLGQKASGCVVLAIVDPKTLAFHHFLWLGGKPGKKLPLLANYQRARRTTPNAKGVKPQRANTSKVRRSDFENLKDIAAVVEKLFGIKKSEKGGLQ
jgi:hypothetical protein